MYVCIYTHTHTHTHSYSSSVAPDCLVVEIYRSRTARHTHALYDPFQRVIYRNTLSLSTALLQLTYYRPFFCISTALLSAYLPHFLSSSTQPLPVYRLHYSQFIYRNSLCLPTALLYANIPRNIRLITKNTRIMNFNLNQVTILVTLISYIGSSKWFLSSPNRAFCLRGPPKIPVAAYRCSFRGTKSRVLMFTGHIHQAPSLIMGVAHSA
jgi:hypothetical protein